MSYTIWDLLMVIGSLGVFIYGMKIMSEGLQKLAGDSLRKILKGMTKNHIFGILTGLVVTVLIQSSSATTVMVVSFVNAGLLQLAEAIGVVMGANIGTTVTAWILSFFGFGKMEMSYLPYIVIAFTFPLLFSSNNKLKNSGEFFIGFGLLFIGLHELKENVPNLKENPEILNFIQNWTDFGLGSTMLFVLLGVIITIIVQSSSATTAITLIMVTKGFIPLELACAMVLGENIGTTITANLAASVANIHAKRVALFHTVFNVLGVIWMLIFFKFFIDLIYKGLPHIPFFEINKDYMDMAIHNPDALAQHIEGIKNSGLTETETQEGIENVMKGVKTIRSSATALFHSLFNIMNVLLLMWFTKPITKLITKVLQSKEGEEDEGGLKYIETGIFDTPELSILQASKELENMGKVIDKMGIYLNVILFEKPKGFNKIIDKIKEREELTDKFEIEISNYLTQCAAGDISEDASLRIRTMLKIVDDMESTADIIYKSAMIVKNMKESKVNIPTETEVEFKKMMEQLHSYIKLMNASIQKFPDLDADLINQGNGIDDKMSQIRNKFKEDHFLRIENGVYSVQNGIHYHDLMINMKRAGGHLTNIMETLALKK